MIVILKLQLLKKGQMETLNGVLTLGNLQIEGSVERELFLGV